MSPSDEVLLFVCRWRVLLLCVVLSAVAGAMDHRIDGDRFLMCPGCVAELDDGKSSEVHTITDEGGRADDDGFNAKVVRFATEVGGSVHGDVSHRKLHSITEVGGRADDDGFQAKVARSVTEVGGGVDGDVSQRKVRSITEVDDRADDDGFNAKVVRSFTNVGGRTDADVSHRNLYSITKGANEVRDITEVGDGKLSASPVLYAARADANTAAAGKWHRVPTDLVSEHNSDGLVAAMMIMIMMTVGRASERKRIGRATYFSAAVLTMLLVAAAFANSATTARPSTAGGIGGGGHNEVAAAAPGIPLTEATAGHSSCTTDPNTQEPVRCIHH